MVIQAPYQKLCETLGRMAHGQQSAEDISLETALARVESPPWTQQADYETNLDQLRDEELQKLADVDVIRKAQRSELLRLLASFRQAASNKSVKAYRLVDAVRARLKLEHMRSAGSKLLQQQAQSKQAPPQQHQHQSEQLQQQHSHVLQQLGRQLPNSPQSNPGTAAKWFQSQQGGTKQTGVQGTPRAVGTQSHRLAMAVEQPQQQQRQQGSSRSQPSPRLGALDSTITQGNKRLAEAGIMQSQQVYPTVSAYGVYGGRPPNPSASNQQQQQRMQANRFSGNHGPPCQHTRQQLNLQANKTFERHGAGQSRQIDNSPWHMAKCESCGISRRAELMVEVPDAKILLCQDCAKQQQQPPRPQAAPLNPRKVPPRNAAAVRAGQAAVRREKANKKGDSDDAPIDLADDTDDEQEQQQRQQLESSPAQDQQQGDAAAQQVSGPAAAARSRWRSNHIVNLLGDGEQGTAVKFAGLLALYPASGGKGAVSVTAEDLERLDADAFLNDTVIDYYIKVLELSLPADVRNRFHFFNSFFFKKLTEKSSATPGQSNKKDDVAKRNHDRVKSWTKGIDIFTKDYLFVPIHDLLHWSLVIICHPRLLESHAASMGWSLHPEAAAEEPQVVPDAATGDVAHIQPTPGMLHLDSMTSGHQSSGVFRPLQLYLEQEWMRKVHEQQHHHAKHHKHNQTAAGTAGNPADGQQQPLRFDKVLPTARVCEKLPKQDNHCDCGLFVLTYLEYFVHAAPTAVDVAHSRDRKSDVRLFSTQPNLLRKDWFEPALASCLRGHLRHRLLELMIEQAPDKDCSAVVAAVADTKQYGEELDEQRRRLEQQQEPGEVNPIFEYLLPPRYFSSEFQQLLQAYQQRRLANKAKRQRGSTGAERLRQQYVSNLDRMHDDDGALGAAADDEDYDPDKEPVRKYRRKSDSRRRKRGINPDEEDQQQQQQQQHRDLRVYGPHLPPAGDTDQGNVSDDFQEARHSRRRAAAAAAAGAASKQQPALLRRESQVVQEMWQQRQQHQDSKALECDPMDVDAMLPDWQLDKQRGASVNSKQPQGPPFHPRNKRCLPPDDAGASAAEHTSSSSSDVTCSDSPKDHSPGEGFVTAADDGETSSGPAEDAAAAAAAAAAGSSGHQLQSAQGGQQAVRRLPPAQIEQQLPDLMQGMSIAAAAATPAATPAPAAAASGGGRARTRACQAAAAAAESVDLCSNDEEEDHLQQQQQHLTDAPAVSGGKRARRNAAVSTDAPNPQQKAWNMVMERFNSDKRSITQLHAMISNEFARYQQFAHELAIDGAVPDCDREAVRDMIKEEWEMKQKPPQDLLPHLVRLIKDCATDRQANQKEVCERWAAMLPGNQQQQQQSVSKKLRSSSAAGGAAKAAAAVAIDSKQRTLKGMVLQIEAPGRKLHAADFQKMQSDLQQRAAEEDAAAAAATAADTADGDPFDSPQDELNLELSPGNAPAGPAGDDVHDLASSDSDVEVVDHHQQQQPAPQQQQRPSAPNPWSPGGVAAVAAKNPGCEQQTEQRRKLPRRCIQAVAQQSKVQQAVKQVLEGAAAPEALRHISASTAGAGSDSDSGYVTADDGGEGQHLGQGPDAVESRPAAGTRTRKQQTRQAQPHNPMAVGAFIEELQNVTGRETQHAQPQLQGSALPQLGLQGYASSADHDESAVTDDGPHVPAGEVTSPPQQNQGRTRLRNTATWQVPGPSALQAEAAAKLQKASQHYSRTLAAQPQQQGQGVTSMTARATRGTAGRAAGMGDGQQQPRTRGRGSCGESVKGGVSSDHAVTLVSD